MFLFIYILKRHKLLTFVNVFTLFIIDVDIGHGSEDTNNKEEVISKAEYAIHYQSMRDNSTDIVTDTSDDLFFLYGELNCLALCTLALGHFHA